MRTIYKYPLEFTDRQQVSMPVNAKLLCMQMQNGIPCIWAEVDSREPLTTRRFEMFGTGHPMQEAAERCYVGTCQLDALVFHVYERVR